MKFGFGISEEVKELKKFEKLSEKERSIVFYAENKASINHFRLLISELTEIRNLQICYITSMKDDPILTTKNRNILPFYIGNGTVRIKFFIFLKAKILIMDMPDLETFHIKRSKVFPVHYIYIFHSMFSVHSYLRKGAIDKFDTIFCVGEHHKKEIRETEKVYGLKPKKLVDYGFGRLDTLLQEKKEFEEKRLGEKDLILITPSYGKNNLLEKCGVELLEILLKSDFKVLLRPHFKIFEESKELIQNIHERFDMNSNFTLEEGIIPTEKFHSSRCMISDWSGISLEYAFTFERPVIFINVPKKVLNQDSNDISIDPIEISIRDKIGYVIEPKNLEQILEKIREIDNNSFRDRIREIRSETVYNIGNSANIGAGVIEEILVEINKHKS
jgi:YidC/Oxa1 family membrane protein insertase